MKHLIKSSVVAIALFGSTLSASAHVSGGDPRPQAVTAQHVSGGDPRPQAVQPVSVWTVILSFFGVSGS